MIVTRLKRGWRIHLTDNEIEALRAAVEHGMADFVDPAQSDSYPNGVRRTLRSARWQAIEGPLTTDEDRRPPSPTPISPSNGEPECPSE
jgi:hypothetical protein